jgi:hypothetical protein
MLISKHCPSDRLFTARPATAPAAQVAQALRAKDCEKASARIKGDAIFASLNVPLDPSQWSSLFLAGS